MQQVLRNFNSLTGELLPRDHLVIPDDHAFPEDNFRRYEWLGQYIMEHMPEVIIKLGDSWEMGSLCHYDKGKKDFVFKNVKEDIEAGHKAEAIMFAPLMEYNALMAKWKKKQYKPIVIKIMGNHEARVQKLLDYEPKWEGTISMDDFKTRLPLDETIVDYMDFIIVDGVAYSHYFVSGTMARPFASARAMLAKRAMSCTMGHTHSLDVAVTVKPTGQVIRGLIAGGFHDEDNASFAGVQVDNIWYDGVMHKHDVVDGDYDLEEISIKRLRRMYSNV
jgi:hypothetical protein